MMLREKLERVEKIIIYGAGAMANLTYVYLKSQKMLEKVLCFAVSRRENNPITKNDYPVIELEAIDIRDADILYLIATQEVVQDEIAQTLQQKKIKSANIVKIDSEEILNLLYEECYKEPIADNKVFFMNMKGLGYGGNPKYIAQKIIELDVKKNMDLVWAVSDESYSFPPEIRTVIYGSMEYYQELATSRIWIDNMRKASDVKKREGQFYIQAWHGAAPLKKVEQDALQALPPTYIENAKRDSEMADLFLSGSEFYTKLYQESFWYDGDILKVGLPRQDIFWNTQEARNKVYQYYEIDESKALVLYAPTFRKNFQVSIYDLDIQKIQAALETRFGKKFVFAISKHPNNRNLHYLFEYGDSCIDVGAYDDFQEILAAADILITDYSGCVYDFSFTKRPAFLYQSDYDKYKNERNFYIPINEMPYVSAKSNEELVQKIMEFKDEVYQENLALFMNKLRNYDKGCASEKVAKLIFDICAIEA